MDETFSFSLRHIHKTVMFGFFRFRDENWKIFKDYFKIDSDFETSFTAFTANLLNH